MDREFSKDISKYKRKAVKGFSKKELFTGIVIVVIFAGQMYLFMALGMHKILAFYLAMPLTMIVGMLGIYKIKGYTLLELYLKRKELMQSSGAMPYRSDEEKQILKLVQMEKQKTARKEGNNGRKKG